MTLNDFGQLVRSGKVTITAYPLEPSAESPFGRFRVEEISNDLPLRETSLQWFEEQRTDQEKPNRDEGDAPDFPVYFIEPCWVSLPSAKSLMPPDWVE